MNSKKKGDVGLGSAIGYFTSNGTPVSIPLTDSQDYDLVVELDGVLKKVQVKFTNCSQNGSFAVPLRIMGGNSKANFVHKSGSDVVYDYLFALTGEGDRYLIPREVFVNNRSTLNLGKKYDAFRV